MTITDTHCIRVEHRFTAEAICACGFAMPTKRDTLQEWTRHFAQRDLPIFLRPHEVLLWADEPASHPVSKLPIVCKTHGQLRRGMFAWDHRITTDHWFGGRNFRIGEDRFAAFRPADGAEPCGGQWSVVFNDSEASRLNLYEFRNPRWTQGDRLYRPGTQCWAVPMCGDCGKYETVDTVQEAYGDRTTCRECGATHWYSIGD